MIGATITCSRSRQPAAIKRDTVCAPPSIRMRASPRSAAPPGSRPARSRRLALRFRRSRRPPGSCGLTPSAVITKRRIPSSFSTLAAGDRRPRGSRMMRAGLGPAQRRTVNKGSSATAVPMPISTASTSARSRCRCARPAGPLMYLECPVTVAIRPSIDCPICPTTTRSSIVPLAQRAKPLLPGVREGAIQGAEIAWNFLTTLPALPPRLSGSSTSAMSSCSASQTKGRR